ncbi:TIGR00282 family metallophosphoesterase [Treponema sp.]
MAIVKIMMIGDVVGDLGIEALEKELMNLASEQGADFIVINGENAAGGFGLTAETLARILDAGADIVTSGNHVWEKRDFWPTLEVEKRVIRPANYPNAPGRGWVQIEKRGIHWAIVNLQGREGMSNIDCPFKDADLILAEIASNQNEEGLPLVFVDFHAESSQEKEALAFYLDGRVQAIVGTHTHVQTADARLLPGGTAYITDLGMTGAVDGIIGMDAAICLERNKTQVPHRMTLATGKSAIRGVVISIDSETKKALSIENLQRVSIEGTSNPNTLKP